MQASKADSGRSQQHALRTEARDGRAMGRVMAPTLAPSPSRLQASQSTPAYRKILMTEDARPPNCRDDQPHFDQHQGYRLPASHAADPT
jgi:hypothetical protein